MGRFFHPVPSAITFALLIVGVTATTSFAQSASTSVQVTGTDGAGVNFRISPGGASIGSFPEGTKMLVVGENKQTNGREWRNVRSPDGVVGWIAAEFLTGSANAPESTTAQVAFRPTSATSGGSTLQVVKTGGLNAVLRDAPGGTQIGSYPEGTSLTLVSSEAKQASGREWRNVQGPDGKSGWMASLLLSGDAVPATVAGGAQASVSGSRSPFTLTPDMRARALAARARAVPLSKPVEKSEKDKEKDKKESSSSSKKTTSSSSSSSSNNP